MNQPPPDQPRASPPWLLIGGLLLGGSLLAYMVYATMAPSGTVLEVTDATWQKEVLESDIPVFVDFTAPWCGPCQDFAPTVAKLASRYEGKFKVCKYDLGERGSAKPRMMADKYNVTTIPHTMIFKNGRAVEFQEGRSEAHLARVFDRVLAGN